MNKQGERLFHLRQRGFEPESILDVGANVGQWYQIARDIFPDAEIYSLEPNPHAFVDLEKVNPISAQFGLGRTTGAIDLYVNANDPKCTGASTYKENTHHYDNPVKRQVLIKTLDSLGKRFDLIKIDVQGAELDVIAGGLNTIQYATFITMELAVMRYNEGAPLINEAIQYMDVHGFKIFDIYELHYMNGALIQIDVCFINKNQAHMLEL